MVLLSGLFSCKSSPSKTEKNNTQATQKRWSEQMAESVIKRNPEGWMLDFSKKLKWNYCHGLVSQAILDVNDAYNKPDMFEYVRQYADSIIDDNGQIYGYKIEKYNIDWLNTGKILFRIHKGDPQPKYLMALDSLRKQIDGHPRTSEGGFWHKKRYPCQMWLDGLYMGAPFYAEYSAFKNDTLAFDDISKQFKLIRKHLFIHETGLYRHGWDECKEQKWADPKTGLSPHVWGRAMGWFSMALVDVLDFIPENHKDRDTLINIFAELTEAVANVQDSETGVWYQVLDMPDSSGNYLESTCSSMFAYSMLKGMRKGYISKSYMPVAKKAYLGIIDQFIKENEDGTISITNCCSVAGLGGKTVPFGII